MDMDARFMRGKMSPAPDPNCPNIVIVPTVSLCEKQPTSPNKQTSPVTAVPHNEVYQTPYYGPMQNNNCISQNLNYPTNWTPDAQYVYQDNNIHWGYVNSQHWSYPDNYNRGTSVANPTGFVTNQLASSDLISPVYNSSPDGIHYTQIHKPVPIEDLTISDDPVVDLAEPLVPVVVVDHKDKEPSVLVDPEALNICPGEAEGSISLDNDDANRIKITATSNINNTAALQKITLANGNIIKSKTREEIEANYYKQIVEEFIKKTNIDENYCHVNKINQETSFDKVAVEVEFVSKSNDDISHDIDKMLNEFIKKNKVASHKEKMAQALIRKTGDQYLEETIKSPVDCKINQETITLDKVAVEVEPVSKSSAHIISHNINKMIDEFIKKNKSVVASHKEKMAQALIRKTRHQYLEENCNPKKDYQAGTEDCKISNNKDNNECTINIEKMVDECLEKTNKAIEENKERLKISSKKKYTTTKELKEAFSKNLNSAVPRPGELEPETKSININKREIPKYRNEKLMPSSSSKIEKLKLQLEAIENEIDKRKRQLEIKEQLIQNEIETLKSKKPTTDIFENNTADITSIRLNPAIETNDSKVKHYKKNMSCPKYNIPTSIPECPTTQVSNPARQLKSVVNVPRKQAVPKDNNGMKSIVNVPRKLTVLKDSLKYKKRMYNKDALKKTVITKNVTEISVRNENTGIKLKMKYSNGPEKHMHKQNDLQIKCNNESGLAAENDKKRKVTVQKKRKRESNEDTVSNMSKRTKRKTKRIELIIKLVREDSESDTEKDSDHHKSENDQQNDNKSASDLSFLDDIDVDEIANFLNENMQGDDGENKCINTNETISHHNVPKSFNDGATESISGITDYLNQTRPKDTLNIREDTLTSLFHEDSHVHFRKECQQHNALQQNCFGRQQTVPYTVLTSNLEEHPTTNELQIDRFNDMTDSDKETSTIFHTGVPVDVKMDLDTGNAKEDEIHEISLELVSKKIDIENDSDIKEEVLDTLKYDVKNASTETINILGYQETVFPDESSNDSFVLKTEVEDTIKEPIITEFIDLTELAIISAEVNTRMDIDTTPEETLLPVIKNEPVNITLLKPGEPSTKENCPKKHVSNSHETNETFEAMDEKTKKNISVLIERGKTYSTIDQQNIDMNTTGMLFTKSHKTCVKIAIKKDSVECVGKTDMEDAVEENVRTEITEQHDVIIICKKEVNTNKKRDTLLNTEHSESQTEENCNSPKVNVPYSHEEYERYETMSETTETNISLLADHEQTNEPNTDKTCLENPKEIGNHLQDNSKTDADTIESSKNIEKNKIMIQNPTPQPNIKCKDIRKLQYAKVILIPAEPKSKATKAEYENQITIVAKRLSKTITKFTGVKHTISSIVHRGTFSTMYKCNDSLGNSCVAKVLNYSSSKYNTNKEKYKILTDMQTGVSLDKLCMVSLKAGMWYDKTFCYVMDYYPKNLEQALREAALPFHIDLVQELARQLVAAVVLLRNHKLVHSDIKPTHILLTANNKSLKLCGFDDAYHMETAATAEIISTSGSVQYRPPEVILGHTYSRGYTIDVWSTALVLYEMATRSPLIDGTTNNEVLYQQLNIFGAAPQSMLQQCQLKDVHYCRDVFMRTGSVNEPNVPQGIRKDSRHLTASAYLFNAYFKHHLNANAKTFEQKTRDIASVRKFCNLLAEMLHIDPLKRITIEFVYANPFIYPTNN